MSRIAYVNGRYVSHNRAQVSIDDRGLQFADGVYEVIAIFGGRLIDLDPHMDRLRYSLKSLEIPMPMAAGPLKSVIGEVARRNGISEGIAYLQVDRGVAPRNHIFPDQTKASVIITARRAKPATAAALDEGVDVVTVPDIRWRRRDIKSISLLPNILAKQSAKEADAFEAWQVDESGYITEGAQSNAWIVTQDGTLVTRPASNDILTGITRLRLIALARNAGHSLELRSFSVDEAKRAREAFLTSTSSFVVPVNRIDGEIIANGRPGSITESLREAYIASLNGGAGEMDLQFGPCDSPMA